MAAFRGVRANADRSDLLSSAAGVSCGIDVSCVRGGGGDVEALSGGDHQHAAARHLVLVDLANVPMWLHAMQLANRRPLGKNVQKRRRGFLHGTSAVMVAVCEPRAWSRRRGMLRLPWVAAGRRHGRVALVPVEGGDECGDFALCIAAAFASTLASYSSCTVVSDDLQLTQRLQALHSEAFLTVLNPCGTLEERDRLRGGWGIRRQDHNFFAEAAMLRPAAVKLLRQLERRGSEL